MTDTSGRAYRLDCLPFNEIWCADFEFFANDGDNPTVVCLVAKEARSGRTIRLWRDELVTLDQPPFDTGPEALVVAYYASAEINCFLALGWEPPQRILDLFTEFRAATNGMVVPHGNGLLGALAYFGLPAIGAADKDIMRDLIIGGGPWDALEQKSILDYCQSDVDALLVLLPALSACLNFGSDHRHLRLGQALFRGRYMAAAARMEFCGVPIDVPMLERLRRHWDDIKLDLIADVDGAYGVFEGTSFKTGRFETWLMNNNIPWPRLQSGALALDDDTFRQMSRAFAAVAPLRELRHALGTLRLNDLHVGSDGRNRALLSPFRAKTGRNQPSNSRFIFGPSRWLRGLIKPAEGYGIAYLDFASQEIAIAAALSGDTAMMEAYTSGDPYMAFAVQAGLAPHGATKTTHKSVRDNCKAIVLGVSYGMGPESIAHRAGLSVAEARELLQRHCETYRTFWNWAETNVNTVLAGGTLTTAFGWPIRYGYGAKANTRSLLNFPMQANGAEMLRLAACEATEAGLRICAPIHDALLLESPLDRLDHDVDQLRSIMVSTSRAVMQSLECRVDAEIFRYPDRYRDESGGQMWDRVVGLLDKI